MAGQDFLKKYIASQKKKAVYMDTPDAFLKKNLATISNRIEAWKLHMLLCEPERYRNIEHIVHNAEKNITAAREKAIHIDHWVRFDISINALFS